MNQRKKVIIVGAGIGGLCAGIRLLKKGFDVEIHEKASHSGGLCYRFLINDRFLFDCASSSSIIPYAYREIFEDIGYNPDDYFEFVKLKEHFRVFYADGLSFDLSSSLDELLINMRKVFNNTGAGYLAYLQSAYKKYQIAEKQFLNQAFMEPSQIFNPGTIFNTFRVNSSLTAYRFFKRFIQDDRLIDCLLLITLFVGFSPFKLPSVYGLIPAIIQTNGLNHIKGGLGVYSEALEKIFRQLGGKINFNSPVEEILFKDRKAIGIRTGDGPCFSDGVLINSDYCYSLKQLIPILSNRKRRKVARFKLSCSVFLLRLGLDVVLPGLSVHNLFINEHFRQEIEGIFKGIMPQTPSLYIYYPASYDESFIKEGHTTLNILVRVPNLSFGHAWDTQTIEEMKHKIKNALLRIPLLSTVAKHIVYEDILTPLDYEKTHHYYKGQGFGIAHTYFQSMAFRPQIMLKKYRKLYFVGSNIHPGTGITFVMRGAKKAAEIIERSVLYE